MKQHVFIQAFLMAMKQWRVAAIVFGCQFALALTLGMQAHSVLESSIGNSLEINKLLINYDHTVMTDFLKVHGASITPLIGQLRWLLLVWLVFSVFMNAGMLYAATSKDQPTVKSFWVAGANYFFPFLKISLVFLGMTLCWTTLIFLPIALFLEPSFQYFSSEQYSVWLVLGLLLIYFLGLAVLFIWSVISRLEKIRTGGGILHNILKGWQVFRKNTRYFLLLLLGFIAFQLILFLLYWLLEAWIGMTSFVGIVFLFFIQQSFVFFRIQSRQMIYAGVNLLAPVSTQALNHVP
jgi:hypothetical protein